MRIQITLQKNIDRHRRENAYFTFILQGGLIESTETDTYNCLAGSLLFHNLKDPHYKIKPANNTKCFHIELVNTEVCRACQQNSQNNYDEKQIPYTFCK
jgi:hypothetical protein